MFGAEPRLTHGARRAPVVRRELLLFLLATVATALATWPLAAELFTFDRLADQTLDDHVYWWDFWWTHRALVVQHVSPLFCPDVVREALTFDRALIPHALIPIGLAAADPVRRPRRPLSELIVDWR